LSEGQSPFSFSLWQVIASVVFIALLLVVVNQRFEIAETNQKLKRTNETFGVSGQEGHHFDVICLGETVDTGKSSELAGAYLIRVSDYEVATLELSSINGATGKESTTCVPFVGPQMALSVSTLYSEIDGSENERAIRVQRTDEMWLGEFVEQFTIPYFSHFMRSSAKESGLVHDRAVLSIAFYAGKRPKIDRDKLNSGSVSSLREIAIEHKVNIVFCKLVATRGKTKGTQLRRE